MTHVLVVEFDEETREVLHYLLTTAGHYTVTDYTEETTALDALAQANAGMVVVVSNRDADHHRSAAFFAAVVANQRLARRHHYVMLSTNPAGMPAGMQLDLAHVHAATLAKPFDVDVLLAAVVEAAAPLVSRPAPVRFPAQVSTLVRRTRHRS